MQLEFTEILKEKKMGPKLAELDRAIREDKVLNFAEPGQSDKPTPVDMETIAEALTFPPGECPKALVSKAVCAAKRQRRDELRSRLQVLRDENNKLTSDLEEKRKEFNEQQKLAADSLKPLEANKRICIEAQDNIVEQ